MTLFSPSTGPARPPVAREGRIANPDPANLTVTLTAFDGEDQVRHEWGPCELMPRGHLLPARGARCLVVESETRRPHVVWWEGATPAAPAEPRPFAPLWQTPAFASGWADYGGLDPNYRLGFTKNQDGLVRLRGIVSRPTTRWSGVDELMVTLPAGFRPGQHGMWPVLVYGGSQPGSGRVNVLPDGSVRLFYTTVAWATPGLNLVGLDGISYWAEG